MRRLLWLLILLSANPVLAQYTAVTGTVTDTNGLPYSNAQLKAQLVFTSGVPVTGQPTVTVSSQAQCNAGGFGTAPCQIPFPGTFGPVGLDGNGNLPAGGIQLANNTLVTPSSTQWHLTVNETPGIPPPGGTGPQTCTAQVTISGATQSVTSNFSACPALSKVSVNVNTLPLGTTIYESTACPGNTPQCFQVFNDVHGSVNAVYTNGSQIVQTAATDPAFVATDG